MGLILPGLNLCRLSAVIFLQMVSVRTNVRLEGNLTRSDFLNPPFLELAYLQCYADVSQHISKGRAAWCMLGIPLFHTNNIFSYGGMHTTLILINQFD